MHAISGATYLLIVVVLAVLVIFSPQLTRWVRRMVGTPRSTGHTPPYGAGGIATDGSEGEREPEQAE